MNTDCYAIGVFTTQSLSNEGYKQHAKPIAGREYSIIFQYYFQLKCVPSVIPQLTKQECYL